MKEIFKIAGAGIFGFITGGLFGFYGTRKVMEKKINQVVKAEFTKYMEEHSKPVPPETEPDMIVVGTDDQEIHDVKVIEDDEKSLREQAEEIIAFNQYARREPVQVSGVKEVPDVAAKDAIPISLVGPFRSGTVYIIDDEEYDNSPDYTKTSVSYYPSTDEYYDERDELIDPKDVEGLLGSNISRNFGILSKDPDIVYVRNKNQDLYIEVARIGGYHDD